jgi:hypothetical protein
MYGDERAASPHPDEPEDQPNAAVHRLILILPRILVVMLPIQIIAVFTGEPIALHAVTGLVIGMAALTLLVTVQRAGRSRDLRMLSRLLVFDLLLQPLLLVAGHFVPFFTALHGPNGILSFGVAIMLVIESESA